MAFSLVGTSGVPRRWNQLPPRGVPITARLLPAAADSTPGSARSAATIS